MWVVVGGMTDHRKEGERESNTKVLFNFYYFVKK